MNSWWSLVLVFLGSGSLAIAESNLQTELSLNSIRAADLLPAPESLPGWEQHEAVKLYPPKELYLLVDGAAPLYHSYGFRELSHAVYRNKKIPTLEITADIYDQGTVEGGYGVYTSGRRATETFQKWGTEGYRSGSILIVWKNRFYISLSASEETPESAQTLELLAQKIAAKIPGEDVYPPILRLLPEKDRIAHTELYAAKSYLGFPFLTNAVSASYRVDSTTAILFVAEYDSQAAARNVFMQYTQVLKEKAEEKRERANPYPLRYRPLGLLTAAQKHRYVFSVFSKESDITLGQLQSLLERCEQGLPPS